MFKSIRKRKQIEKNSTQIKALHSELTQELKDPSLDPNAPFPMTPEFKAKQDEYVALCFRNLDLLDPTKK